MNLSNSLLRLTPSALTLAILMGVSGCSEAPQQEVASTTLPQGDPIQGEPIEATPTPALESELTDSPETHLANQATEDMAPPSSTTASASDALTEPIAAPSLQDPTQVTEAPLPEPTTSNAGNPEEPIGVQSTQEEKIPLLPGFLPVSFEKLASFNYEMPEDLTAPVADEEGVVYKEQIPEAIHALNQKAISLKGFMLPLKVEQGLVTEMLIMRDQSMCCYGTVPKINEWVSVRMTEEGVKPVMDEPVTIHGTLKVGEVLENGYLVGIYEMDGQQMTSDRNP
jgi:hypothetical protein